MAYSLVWTPDVLLQAKLEVLPVEGWQDRGRGELGPIHGVLRHHTAGSRNGNMPSLRNLISACPRKPVRGTASHPTAS